MQLDGGILMEEAQKMQASPVTVPRFAVLRLIKIHFDDGISGHHLGRCFAPGLFPHKKSAIARRLNVKDARLPRQRVRGGITNSSRHSLQSVTERVSCYTSVAARTTIRL